MASVRYRSVSEIKETLRNAKARGRGCTLLIGAGCSFKAGIPTAAGFVDIVRDRHSLAYDRASEKTYPRCMAELLPSERRDLIASYVDQAQLNWAHICMALLMQAGYVDRILTTNFDLLAVRACAVLGVFPAIYDFATSQLLKRADIPDQAVFYLHGQRTGFVLMNTIDDMATHSALLGPVFEDALSGRVWIVVGYSGENDPVFNHLASVPRFDNGLFWIGYGDREPAHHVRERLLRQDKDAFFTKGYDADSFFVALTRQLGIFPPDLVARPFTYLERALTGIAPFVDPGQGPQGFQDDVMRAPRTWIQNAIAQFETPAWEIITQGRTQPLAGQQRSALHTVAAQYLLMAGRYEEVLAFRQELDASPSPDLANVLSMAYVMHGNVLLDRAKTRTGEGADDLFCQAKEMYESALEVMPRRHEALHNWGNLLLDQAKMKTGSEADALFTAAEEKYRDALAMEPGRYEVLINWGNLLLDRAKASGGEAAVAIFAAAETKYRAAIEIEPMMPAVLISWGNLLLDRARTLAGSEADPLFLAAEEKYKTALSVEPARYEALVQWANVLLDRAKLATGETADQFFAAAEEKYRAALAIRPDMYEISTGLGNLFLDRAKRQTGQDAERLFTAGRHAYQAALDIKPGSPDVLENLGNLLHDWGKTKTGDDAQRLQAEAEEMHRAARATPPGPDAASFLS
jgi:Tfp pilus assembly protein PilF